MNKGFARGYIGILSECFFKALPDNFFIGDLSYFILKRQLFYELRCYLIIAYVGFQHVKRPLLSFGPKTPIKLRTSPTSVCKVTRLLFKHGYSFFICC